MGAMRPPSLWPMMPTRRGSVSGRGGEEIQGRLRVRGEIQAGRRAEAARGRGGAAVVIAQDRYAPAGEGVGDDEEGLVAEYGLVPVLCSGARDEDDGGEGTRAFGDEEAAGKRDPRGAAGNPHLLAPVGIGRLGRLRTRETCRFRAARKAQGEVHAALAPGSGDGKTVLGELSREDRAHGLEGDDDLALGEGHGRRRDARYALARAVHGRGEAAALERQVEDQGELRATDVKGT